MPKRLLFVDDDAMILSGLRRALHGMRGDWEMDFVGSGEAALRALDEKPYDAIITDMRMPVMDGAQLLEHTKQRHPDVMRMVLSGQSSRAALYRSLSLTHQFLSKPCDPQELASRLTQAFAPRDLLANQALKTIVARLKSLPSLPIIYEELTAALRLEDPSIAQLERIIAKDVGMAAKILQLANSAFIGASGRVTSLLQAMSLIGTEAVRMLVLSVHVFSQFDGNPKVAAYLPVLWDHSVSTASLAQHIATSEGVAKPLVEECFTAGLLHDVGKAVLLSEMPVEYRLIVERKEPPAQEVGELESTERKLLGCTHAEIGAYLMSIWGLPLPLVRAVAFHHCPAASAETEFSSLTAVHAADAIVASVDSSPLNRDTRIDLGYLEALGFGPKVEVWRGLFAADTAAKQQAMEEKLAAEKRVKESASAAKKQASSG